MKCKLIYSDIRSIVIERIQGKRERLHTLGERETYLDLTDIHYLDCGDGDDFISIDKCLKLPHCEL